MNKIAIVIPTYNGGPDFKQLLAELAEQSVLPSYKLVIDSSSTDDTVAIAKKAGWQVVVIPKEEFSHGGTRQQALDIVQSKGDVEYIIYITQDIRIPQKDSLEKLVKSFVNPDVAAAYGRQRPHIGASIYAAVDREFNYPAISRIKSMADVPKLGIRTAFLSDSFAAYRVSALQNIGGFPALDICEDMYVAGKLLLAGKKIAYVAEAWVHHSHEFKITEVWNRYRTMGRFQKHNKWIRVKFGQANSEGQRLIRHQIKKIYAVKGITGIVKIFMYDSIKLIAYKWDNMIIQK